MNAATLTTPLGVVATTGAVVTTAVAVRARVVEALVTAARVVVGVAKAVETSSSMVLSTFVSWTAVVVAATTAAEVLAAGRVTWACWAKNRYRQMRR